MALQRRQCIHLVDTFAIARRPEYALLATRPGLPVQRTSGSSGARSALASTGLQAGQQLGSVDMPGAGALQAALRPLPISMRDAVCAAAAATVALRGDVVWSCCCAPLRMCPCQIIKPNCVETCRLVVMTCPQQSV